MNNKTFLIVPLMLLAQLAFSQKNFVPGYIVKSDQDTIRGYINDRGWDQNPKTILFRQTPSDQELEYNTNQIKEFKILGGPHYFGFIVDIDKSPYKVSQMEKYLPSESIVRDTIFLELVDRGKLDLYRLRDDSDKYHFYYSLNGGNPQELILKIVFEERKGVTSMITTATYKSQLQNLMADCSQVLPTIKNLKYVEREMMKLFNSYNKCVGESITMEAQAETEFEWLISAGVSQTQLKFNGPPGINFQASTDPTFAVALNTIFPRNKHIWSVYSEIQYKSYNTISNGSTYLFDLGYLKVNAAYRYTRTQSKIKPFLQAGITVGHAFKYESNRDFDKLDPGILVSTGVRPKKLGAELRLEKSTGMFPSFPIQSSVTSLYLLLSYKVN